MYGLTINGQFLAADGYNHPLPVLFIDIHTWDPGTRIASNVPIAKNVAAVLDTGAGASVFNYDMLNLNGIKPFAVGSRTTSADTVGSADNYWLQIRPTGVDFKFNAGVAVMKMAPNQPFAGLIGMDLISRGRLTVSVSEGILKLEL